MRQTSRQIKKMPCWTLCVRHHIRRLGLRSAANSSMRSLEASHDRRRMEMSRWGEVAYTHPSCSRKGICVVYHIIFGTKKISVLAKCSSAPTCLFKRLINFIHDTKLAL
jgi:hypothetical protein